jgi:hypothetical protein
MTGHLSAVNQTNLTDNAVDNSSLHCAGETSLGFGLFEPEVITRDLMGIY